MNDIYHFIWNISLATVTTVGIATKVGTVSIVGTVSMIDTLLTVDTFQTLTCIVWACNYMVTRRHADNDFHYHIKVTSKPWILISNTLYYIKKNEWHLSLHLKYFFSHCHHSRHCHQGRHCLHCRHCLHDRHFVSSRHISNSNMYYLSL